MTMLICLINHFLKFRRLPTYLRDTLYRYSRKLKLKEKAVIVNEPTNFWAPGPSLTPPNVQVQGVSWAITSGFWV